MNASADVVRYIFGMLLYTFKYSGKNSGAATSSAISDVAVGAIAATFDSMPVIAIDAE